MKITINKINIEDNPINEVTSHKVFKSRKVFDADGNPIFHEEGIFSDKIFGKFGKCKCGHLTTPGICQYCGTRVLDPKRIPDFYIKFDGIDIPYITINTSKYPKLKHLKDLFNYEGFLYNGKYVEYDLSKLNLTLFDPKKVLIGKDAILSLGVDEAYYESQVTNKMYIPHTSLRKITIQGDQLYLGQINTTLIDILKKKHKLQTFSKLSTKDIFTQLSIRKELISSIQEVYHSLYEMLSTKKKSIISREVRGQGITGAARAVITNNFELDEDVALIGYHFIPTLYPHLYDKYTDENGTDIEAINEELKDYLILINRQPTIGEKSIMAFHPVFSDDDDAMYVLQLNPLVMDGYAGDYDGDVLLMIALYTKEACMDAVKLLPSKNYLGGSNGNIRNGIFEDLEYVMQKSFEDNKADDIHKMIMGKSSK